MRLFYKKVENENSDSKSLWHSLKELGMLSKKGKASANAIGLKIDGEVCFDKCIVVEKFKSFILQLHRNLLSNCQTVLIKLVNNLLKGVKPYNYTFNVVSENKVLKYLNNLSAKKATGLDGIPARFVRDSTSTIICPLSNVINLSLIQGTVPDDMKSARIVPLFKKSDKTEVRNYRHTCDISRFGREIPIFCRASRSPD